MKKQTDKTKLRKQCSDLAKKIARIKADYKCAYCGIGEPQRRTHGSHIFSEGAHRMMSADVDNILCMCAAHHMTGIWNASNKEFNWHGSPGEAWEWFMEKYPELYLKLKKRTQEKLKDDIFFWQKKKILLTEELNNL